MLVALLTGAFSILFFNASKISASRLEAFLKICLSDQKRFITSCSRHVGLDGVLREKSIQLLLRPDVVLTSVLAELVEAGANPSTGSGRTVHISQGRINNAGNLDLIQCRSSLHCQTVASRQPRQPCCV
jgi:hypothetical protein